VGNFNATALVVGSSSAMLKICCDTPLFSQQFKAYSQRYARLRGIPSKIEIKLRKSHWQNSRVIARASGSPM